MQTCIACTLALALAGVAGAAQSQTSLGGRVVSLPGGLYPRSPVTLSNPLTCVSSGGDALLGG